MPSSHLMLYHRPLHFQSSGISFPSQLTASGIIGLAQRSERRETCSPLQWCSGLFGSTNWFDLAAVKDLQESSPADQASVLGSLVLRMQLRIDATAGAVVLSGRWSALKYCFLMWSGICDELFFQSKWCSTSDASRAGRRFLARKIKICRIFSAVPVDDQSCFSIFDCRLVIYSVRHFYMLYSAWTNKQDNIQRCTLFPVLNYLFVPYKGTSILSYFSENATLDNKSRGAITSRQV